MPGHPNAHAPSLLRLIAGCLLALMADVVEAGEAPGSGLLHTPPEVAVWAQRAMHGPYRVLGDVSVGSPGDWKRITDNAATFMADPTRELTDDTFRIGYATEPKKGHYARDAAFVSLVLRASDPATSVAYARSVRSVLLAQARSPHTDFSTYAYFNDLAGWVLAEYLIKLLLAYDYIRDAEVLSAAERLELNRWFASAADFYARNLHNALDNNFPLRLDGDYSVVGSAAADGHSDSVKYTHVNADGSKGNRIVALAHWYNNRRFSHALLVGVVDAFLKRAGYATPDVVFTANGRTFRNSLGFHAKAFVTEWLRYSVYPDGMQGEFERGSDDNPFKGFNYSTCNLFSACLLAEVYARSGDDSLYEYRTSAGLWGTAGGSKSIRLAVESHLRMVDGSAKRYFKTVTEDQRYRNVQALNDNLHYVSDTWFAMSNLYWRSAYQRGVALHTGPGTVPYPTTRIGSTAGLNPWGGMAHILPGSLFLFGQMDGVVSPYPQPSWVASDTGATGLPGSSTYVPATDTWTLVGAGTGVWGAADAFHGNGQEVSGDVVMVTRVASLTGQDPWAQAGIMIRESTAAGSRHAFVCVTPGRGAGFFRRTTTDGASAYTAGSTAHAPRWLKLQRQGSLCTAWESADGQTWSAIGSATLVLGTTARIGLVVTSRAPAVPCIATFTGSSIHPLGNG